MPPDLGVAKGHYHCPTRKATPLTGTARVSCPQTAARQEPEHQPAASLRGRRRGGAWLSPAPRPRAPASALKLAGLSSQRRDWFPCSGWGLNSVLVALPARSLARRRVFASAFRGLASFSANLKTASLIGAYCALVFLWNHFSQSTRVRGAAGKERCGMGKGLGVKD